MRSQIKLHTIYFSMLCLLHLRQNNELSRQPLYVLVSPWSVRKIELKFPRDRCNKTSTTLKWKEAEIGAIWICKKKTTKNERQIVTELAGSITDEVKFISIINSQKWSVIFVFLLNSFREVGSVNELVFKCFETYENVRLI